MLSEVYRIVFVYFFIGGIAIVLINRKKSTPGEKTERWIKYLSYLVIVNLVVLSIIYYFFSFLAAAIIIIGLIEMILINKHRLSEKLIIPLVIYAILAYFFLEFTRIPYQILLLIYTLVFTFDGFSQICGQLFGRFQITPKISPNKTWGGFLGGLIATTITSGIFHFTLYEDVRVSFEGSIIVGFIVSVLAFSGDILASYYKRMNNAKDYSNFLPGQGGFLDRFDSFIFVAACAQMFDYFTS